MWFWKRMQKIPLPYIYYAKKTYKSNYATSTTQQLVTGNLGKSTPSCAEVMTIANKMWESLQRERGKECIIQKWSVMPDKTKVARQCSHHVIVTNNITSNSI